MHNKISFNHPASVWEESLPIGNGSFGAMVWGGYASQKFSLNLDTFWSGTVLKDEVENRADALQEHRELIFNRQFGAAEKQAKEKLTYCKNSSSFLPVGDIFIESIGALNTRDCFMELDMRDAVVSETYHYRESPWTKQTDKQTRKTYISNPHNVLISEIQSDAPTTFGISFKCFFKHQIQNFENGFSVTCKAPLSVNYLNNGNKEIVYADGTISYGLVLHIETDGNIASENEQMIVSYAKYIKLYVAGHTNFVNYNTLPDESMDLIKKCNDTIAKAVQDGNSVYDEHIRYHRGFYDRMSIHLPTDGIEMMYADKLRRAYQKGDKSNRLVELMFNYGRYLMICSSAPGTQASNLQGIWNDKPLPMWNGGYTTNINLQMNYWLAESANLSELHQPLIDLIQDLSVAGEQTARDFYGCGGFVTHHNTDIWRKCSPVSGDPWYSVWPMGSGWLCQHLYTKYLYTQDKVFLKEIAYPITRKAARFYLDFLCENKKGELVTCPSVSPENFYAYQNEICSVTEMCAMDKEIVQEIFENTLHMAEILEENDSVLQEIQQALPKLAPHKIGSKGQLLEWAEEFTETHLEHRHLSHLYGIYPGNTLKRDKMLYNAARTALQMRMDNGSGATGWSCGWIILLLAAFKDGENAKRYLDKLITDSTYPNLFDAHPPFQIDGNFAFTAAVLHMVLQSEIKDGKVILDILPAIPKAWEKGEFKGICAMGGITADITWTPGEVRLCLTAKQSQNITVRFGDTVQTIDVKESQPKDILLQPAKAFTANTASYATNF